MYCKCGTHVVYELNAVSSPAQASAAPPTAEPPAKAAIDIASRGAMGDFYDRQRHRRSSRGQSQQPQSQSHSHNQPSQKSQQSQQPQQKGQPVVLLEPLRNEVRNSSDSLGFLHDFVHNLLVVMFNTFRCERLCYSGIFGRVKPYRQCQPH